MRSIADDACWNRKGHALTIGDELRQGVIPLQRAGKSAMTKEAGLARLRTMLWATDRNESQPWIKASWRCRAFLELTLLLARDTKQRELLLPTRSQRPLIRPTRSSLGIAQSCSERG